MALSTSELARIKFELGYNLLSVSAEPLIGVTQLFEQVVQPYLTSGAATTSSTTVAASATPAPVAITLADATGFSAGNKIVVDVDDRQEYATIQSKSGSAVTVLLTLAHAGSYPVTVEGGESIVRGILRQIQQISGIGTSAGGLLGQSLEYAGLKRVDKIEWFGPNAGGAGSTSKGLAKQLDYWRDELARALGVPNLRGRGDAGSDVAMY